MATLFYVELFALQGVRFRFQSQLPTGRMGLETGSESEFRSVNILGSLPVVVWMIVIPINTIEKQVGRLSFMVSFTIP